MDSFIAASNAVDNRFGTIVTMLCLAEVREVRGLETIYQSTDSNRALLRVARVFLCTINCTAIALVVPKHCSVVCTVLSLVLATYQYCLIL